MARWFLLVFGICIFCTVASCSRPVEPVPVNGTVNLNGKPLKEGSITLIGEEGSVPDTLPVQNGKFDGKSKPGKKRVEIRAFKMGKPYDMGDEIIEAGPVNYLPARYNTNSKLTAEVTADGINPSKFDVESN